MKKVAVALIALSFILTSCSGNAGNDISGKTSIVTKANANYLEYSQSAVSQTKWDKVIFFHAAWCGSCVSASKNISESATTDNLTIFKVEFDDATELREKYGVTAKHTFVQVDDNGEMINKWSGSPDIADIQKNIKTANVTKQDNKTNKEKVLDLAHKMEKDAMNEVKSIYPDLAFVKTIAKDDNINLMGMSEEDWLYSAEHDVTVVSCKGLNTPSYIFDGKNISDAELAKVKTEMKEMMDMMMEGWDMDMMGEHGEMMMDDMKMEDHDEASMMKKEGKFVAYSAKEVAGTEGTKVLFFHAKWCPACTGAAKNLSAWTAPEGLNVFKVDYDTSTELKKQYGIVGQHTFVQIDDNGKMLKRWFGSRNYEDILAQL